MALVFCGGMIWLDYHPIFTPEVPEFTSPSLNDLTLDDLDVQKQSELEAQKEAERRSKTRIYRLMTCAWVITILVVNFICTK